MSELFVKDAPISICHLYCYQKQGVKGKFTVNMLESILKDADSGHYLGEQMFQVLIRFCSICVQYTLNKAFLPTQPPLDRLTRLFSLVHQVKTLMNLRKV